MAAPAFSGSGSAATGANPFRMPSDEELFFLREEERRTRLSEREQMRNRKIFEKTTSTSGATHIQGGFRDDSRPIVGTKPKLPSEMAMGADGDNNNDWNASSAHKAAAAAAAAGGGGGSKVKNSMSAYIKRKRKMGLERMSLQTKRVEIRKLDEEAARAEKRIKQQEEQLHETRVKFQAFLQTTDQDQVEARQRAELETKAKQEKVQENKKLLTQIAQIDAEVKKLTDQLNLCMEYKRFLDTLTDPEWFYDTLIGLRIEDATAAIRAAADQHRHALAVAAAQQGSGSGGGGGQNSSSDEEIALQIARLDERMDSNIKSAADSIRAEVKGMKLAEVKRELDEMDADRVPMFFTSPDQILMKFLDIEENNLFLIRHCQSIEEQKDDIEQKYRIESAEIASIAQQRREQMSTVGAKIAEEEGKLKQVSERINNAKVAGTTADGVSEDDMKRIIEDKVRQIYTASCRAGREGNMESRPLGMLTQIEVKIDEQRQEIKALKIDRTSIANTLTLRDKERRKLQREQTLREKQDDRDKRSKQALERSQAPVKKRVGKPVMKRTAPADFGKKKKENTENKEEDDEDEFFR